MVGDPLPIYPLLPIAIDPPVFALCWARCSFTRSRPRPSPVFRARESASLRSSRRMNVWLLGTLDKHVMILVIFL